MTAMSGRDRLATKQSRLVWDLPVRLFHWVLVVAVIGAFVTNRLGVAYFEYHLWCGYTVLVAVAFRVFWGVFGTRHALFVNFVRGPREVWRYGRALLRGRETVYAGHNPLGGLMVVALLAALGVQAVSGMFSNDEIFDAGPFNALVGTHLSQIISSLHRRLFYGIAIAIALHVAAVLLHQWGRGEDLLRSMVTGRKRVHGEPGVSEISFFRLWLALILVATLVASLVLALALAPAPVASDI